ncbi:phage scaffolding protein [Ligilactobacillus saerimneri]|uniref:phage scaffolding protein n=1 Tax=Ligilactobacillus saerimneri TaxID=228229 RepID=UPI0024B19E4D|nr:phage scaffolding protein [Ligilactobacillus saerimneri]MDI9205904.1 phage scaffolding protein [Ligilactobacillus saerimneri]
MKREFLKEQGLSDEQIKAVMTEPRNSKVLDLDKVSLSDNDLEGLDDQLTALKESDSYLFNVKNEPQPTKSPVNVVSG